MSNIKGPLDYTTRAHLKNFFDQNPRKYAFQAKDPKAFHAWKNELRSALRDITGISRMEKCEPVFRVLEVTQLDGYQRKKTVLQTEKDVWMPFYMLIPDGIKEGDRRAAVIAPHGHGCCGKYGVAGIDDVPVVKRSIERYQTDYGVHLVQLGYIVFCPDARGSGERREWMNQGDEDEKLLSSSCTQLNFAAISLGQSLTGMWVWDLMRLVDYIETLNICDTEKIGCCGFSGGGLQSLWLAAMDDRIKCAVVGSYMHGFRESILKTHLCGCNFVPHLWEYADMGDLAALIAPRPLLIQNGSDDPLNGERGIEDVNEQVEITRQSYKLFGEESKLQQYVFPGGHQWNSDKIQEFFSRWLG
ncbi:MAG: dienelactone hydrolase family protein [Clostridia bacterium]|nr:dienelactone hydrolase family protein [Clostridia bacterium]